MRKYRKYAGLAAGVLLGITIASLYSDAAVFIRTFIFLIGWLTGFLFCLNHGSSKWRVLYKKLKDCSDKLRDNQEKMLLVMERQGEMIAAGVNEGLTQFFEGTEITVHCLIFSSTGAKIRIGDDDRTVERQIDGIIIHNFLNNLLEEWRSGIS